MRVLILGSTDSCRAQMTKAMLKFLRPEWEIESAGITPAENIHSKTILVMGEMGLDVANENPKNVEQFLEESFDYIVTVCTSAQENFPAFKGNIKNRDHLGLEKPIVLGSTEAQVLSSFRHLRDQVRNECAGFVRRISFS